MRANQRIIESSVWLIAIEKPDRCVTVVFKIVEVESLYFTMAVESEKRSTVSIATTNCSVTLYPS